MAYSEIRGFVYRVVDIFPGPLKTPARWVADRIFGIWDDISTVLTQLKPAFDFLHNYFWYLVAQLNLGIVEAAKTLRWLIVEAIPRWSRWALNTAVDYALSAVTTLGDWAANAIAYWFDKLNSALNTVRGFVDGLSSWTFDRLREVWLTLTVIRDRVVLLLTHPDVFVEWVFAALWARFWRFVNEHAEAIAYMGWSRRDVIIAQVMRRIEEWLVRIL